MIPASSQYGVLLSAYILVAATISVLPSHSPSLQFFFLHFLPLLCFIIAPTEVKRPPPLPRITEYPPKKSTIMATGYVHGSDIPPRFLAGCLGDRVEATRRWAITQTWRAANDIDSVLERPMRNFGFIKRFYPHYYCGYGKNGSICYYEECGRIDIPALQAHGVMVADLVDYYLYMTEFCFKSLLPKDSAKCITIFDVAGVSVSDLKGDVLKFIKATSKIMQDHYPEKSQVILVINAPMIFTAVWAIMKQFINERTQSKVRILSPGKTFGGMSEFIEAKDIPVKYGGDLVCMNGADIDDGRNWNAQERRFREHIRTQSWYAEGPPPMMLEES